MVHAVLHIQNVRHEQHRSFLECFVPYCAELELPFCAELQLISLAILQGSSISVAMFVARHGHGTHQMLGMPPTPMDALESSAEVPGKEAAAAGTLGGRGGPDGKVT